jgi:hypothetical protein
MTEDMSAADLIAQAKAATTAQELDAIEAQAAGRVTVESAVAERRAELHSTGGPAMSESSAPPVVDPSPTAPPIMLNTQSLEEVLATYPAPASSEEVLALEPNDYESATEGPHEQISPTMYVHMTKPDGTEFLAPLSNEDYYQRKGYTSGAAEDIPDLVAYWAEKAGAQPALTEPPPEPAP